MLDPGLDQSSKACCHICFSCQAITSASWNGVDGGRWHALHHSRKCRQTAPISSRRSMFTAYPPVTTCCPCLPLEDNLQHGMKRGSFAHCYRGLKWFISRLLRWRDDFFDRFPQGSVLTQGSVQGGLMCDGPCSPQKTSLNLR